MSPSHRVSEADRRLIAALGDDAPQPRQIERWRQAGLLQTAVRHGLGRGRGSISSYPPGTVDQARELLALTGRGRSLDVAALTLFVRGRWVREDVLRRVLSERLDELEAGIRSKSTSADPLDIARDAARADLTDPRRSPLLRSVLHRVRDQHASNPGESTRDTWENVAAALIHVFLTGDADAMTGSDLAQAIDGTGLAAQFTEQLQMTPAAGLTTVMRHVLAAASLPALRRLLADASLDELERGRDQVRTLVAHPNPFTDTPPTPATLAVLALVTTSITRGLEVPE